MRRIIPTFLLFLFSCNLSDKVDELSGNYFLRQEGSDLNDILSHSDNQLDIPSNVTKFNFNFEYIIAEQIPKGKADPLYNNKPNYKHGYNVPYYWIIINSKKKVIGPIDKPEFDSLLIAYQINLKLKELD